MKVKERQGVKSGSYGGLKFSTLIRQNNKVGLKESKNGKRVMFRLKDPKGVEIPCSVIWNPEDGRFKSTMGSLGVSAESLAKTEEAEGIEAALLKFEKIAKEKALPVSVYVRDDGGWGTALKPSGANVYTCQFCGVTSKDDSDLPTYVLVPPATRKNVKTGGTYTTSEWKRFVVGLQILAGERKGTILSKSLNYAITKDEDDNWIIDAETRTGAEFVNFLVLHKVAVDNIEPDRDFENPENGLPELEKMMYKHARPLSVTVNEEGWVDKIERLPEGVAIQETNLDEGSDYQAVNIAKLFSVIDKACRVDHKTTAWESDGNLSKAGKQWFRDSALPYMKENSMPLSFKKLTTEQVSKIIEFLAS